MKFKNSHTPMLYASINNYYCTNPQLIIDTQPYLTKVNIFSHITNWVLKFS